MQHKWVSCYNYAWEAWDIRHRPPGVSGLRQFEWVTAYEKLACMFFSRCCGGGVVVLPMLVVLRLKLLSVLCCCFCCYENASYLNIVIEKLLGFIVYRWCNSFLVVRVPHGVLLVLANAARGFLFSEADTSWNCWCILYPTDRKEQRRTVVCQPKFSTSIGKDKRAERPRTFYFFHSV